MLRLISTGTKELYKYYLRIKTAVLTEILWFTELKHFYKKLSVLLTICENTQSSYRVVLRLNVAY